MPPFIVDTLEMAMRIPDRIVVKFIHPEPEAAKESDDVELVKQDSRPGFYRDSMGGWRADRRVCPERRKMTAPKSVNALRKRVRRLVDRQALKFLRGIDD